MQFRGACLAAVLASCVVCAAATGVLRKESPKSPLTTKVRRGAIAVRLVESGVVRAAESMTYRSPIEGIETEIIYLAPEGTRVQEGDLLAKLDATQVTAELDRAAQALRQADLDARIAAAQSEDAAAALEAATDGEGTLAADEARNALELADRKAARLREELSALKPLLDRGFITREELDRTQFEHDQAAADLRLARKRHDILVHRSQPREQQKARLQVAERQAQSENAVERTSDARARVTALQQLLTACELRARRPGLVVYEENLSTAPRRKVRVGDRVTPSQGLVTIPDLSRMLVESSVRESDVHSVRQGESATVMLDAYPGVRLAAHVINVGSLAKADSSSDEKRFAVTFLLQPGGVDLRPEMTARVELLLERKANVVLLPVNAVTDRAGGLFARVVRPWGLEDRRVELGLASDVDVEVIGGLAEGEEVALSTRATAPASAGADGGQDRAFRE